MSTIRRYACVVLLSVGLCLVPGVSAASNSPGEQDSGSPILIHFAGPVEIIGPARWMVAGKSITIGPSTTVVERDAATAVGMWAWVEAEWSGRSSLAAVRIETRTAGDLAGDAQMILNGQIADLTVDSFIVSGKTVVVGPQTVIRGIMALGAPVIVVANHNGDHYLAENIVVLSAADEPLYLEGDLATFDAQEWRLQNGQDSFLLQLTADTVVLGEPVAGYRVEAMALLRPGPILEAIVLRVIEPGNLPVRFLASLVLQIDGTDPEQWIVFVPDWTNGQWDVRRLLVDRATTLVDESRAPIVPGARVIVSAVPPAAPDRAWIARSLWIDIDQPAEVEGPILALNDGALPGHWDVGGYTVIVDANTRLDGRPQPGRYAVIQGKSLSDSVVWATRIGIRYRFRGQVISRSDISPVRRWTVAVPAGAGGIAPGKVFLLLDANTEADPVAEAAGTGVWIEAQARATPDGWLADWVLARSTP